MRSRYFNLIDNGAKTIEVRVAYTANADLAAGWLIRFRCETRTCLAPVRRVTRYPSFEAMLDQEGATAVDPTASHADVLEALRAIYPPEKEALGVLGIEIERADGAS